MAGLAGRGWGRRARWGSDTREANCPIWLDGAGAGLQAARRVCCTAPAPGHPGHSLLTKLTSRVRQWLRIPCMRARGQRSGQHQGQSCSSYVGKWTAALPGVKSDHLTGQRSRVALQRCLCPVVAEAPCARSFLARASVWTHILGRVAILTRLLRRAHEHVTAPADVLVPAGRRTHWGTRGTPAEREAQGTVHTRPRAGAGG